LLNYLNKLMPKFYIQQLEKRRQSQNDDIKFVIANKVLQEKSNNDKKNKTYTLHKYLLNNERITSSDNTLLILAFIENNNLSQSHVVIKIDRHIDKLEKEYILSKLLSKIGNFIDYIAYYTCYDDTNTIIEFKNSRLITNTMITQPLSICEASSSDNNLRGILAMPYYKNGSIANYKWTLSNIELLKKLLKQILHSCYHAYKLYGFLHIDLHLGNIVIDDNFNALIIDLIEHKLYGDGISNTFYQKKSALFIKNIGEFWSIFTSIIDDIGRFGYSNSSNIIYNYQDYRINWLRIFNNITESDSILNDENIEQVKRHIDNLQFITKK